MRGENAKRPHDIGLANIQGALVGKHIGSRDCLGNLVDDADSGGARLERTGSQLLQHGDQLRNRTTWQRRTIISVSARNGAFK